MKVCIKCKKDKELEEFQSEKRKSDGRSARCKECLNEDKRKQLDKVREKIREYNRKKYYEDHAKQKKLKTERSRKSREENKEKVNEWHKKWYWNNVEKARERSREYAKKPKAKKKASEYGKRYRKTEKYRFKDRARNMYEYAIRHGFLIRPNKCENCWMECKPDGHHEDYNKPLEVQWLCKTCHCQAHGKLKEKLELLPKASYSDP